MNQKNVAAIHDISCFGKCSLTVALPILAAAGIETSVIPTAILSTHTGGFSEYTYRDLTKDIMPIAKHWKSLNLSFNAFYTGFLGSFEQIDLVKDIINMFKTDDTLILVDPVMADHGKLYKVFDNDFPLGMKSLCKKADIITPNITEACLLTNTEYKEGPYEKGYIENLLEKLNKIGAKKIVLTGVYFEELNLGTACYDCKDNEISYAFTEKIHSFYHGTGDVFSSVLLSAILNEKSLKDAAQIAAEFTAGAINRSKLVGTDIRFGVNFEQEIPALLKQLNLI